MLVEKIGGEEKEARWQRDKFVAELLALSGAQEHDFLGFVRGQKLIYGWRIAVT